MQHSKKDSDEDVESKTGHRTRVLTTQSMVDSPIRRSSRIKQSTKLQKSSPDSESDTSVSSQPVRTTRQRTATMDSITETLKGHRVRKPSISSEASETLDIDVGTPSKRTTRRSFVTATHNTPTRASTRTTNKRFVRAGSETTSPPSFRTTRRTRASSVDPETMSDQSKCVPNISTKIRKRASVLPSQSPVKEEIEEKQQEFVVKVDSTLSKDKEFTSSGHNSSLDKIVCSKKNQEVKEIDNTNKDKVEKDNSSGEMILIVTSDEASQQLDDNEIHSKHTIAIIADRKSCDKEQSSCAKDLSSDVEIEKDDEILIDDTNVKEDKKGDKSSVIENEECLTGIEDSLRDTCKKSPTKELTVRLENIFETSIGGQKRSPSNKENQTLNIINDTSAEKNTGSVVTNITSLNTKSLTTVFMNKSLNEKDIKFTKNESSLGKRRHSRESTETTVKHTAVLRENSDNIEEITDSSTDPVNPIVIHEKKNLDSSSIDNTTKKQSLVHDVYKKSTTNDTIKLISALVNNTELVEEIVDSHISVEVISRTDENATNMANKLNKSVTNNETYNEITDSKRSSCFVTVNDDSEMVLELEESNASQDKNKLLNESMKTVAESNLDDSNESIDVETCDDKFIDKLVPITQDETKDDLLDSTEQTKKNLSHITKSTSKLSITTLETINPSSNDLNTDNAMIQNMQSGDMEVSEEFTADMPSKKVESMNTSLKITTISTQRENEDTSVMIIEENSIQLNQEDKSQEDSNNMEIGDDKSDVEIVSTLQDISADEWKKDVAETKEAVEDISNPMSVENESEAECDLVLVDKQAWLAAENIKAVRDKECFEYDSDDTVLLKSKLDIAQANSNKKRLSAINEALLINIDDDDEEEEEKEERKKKVAKSIKTQKSSIKRKSATEKSEDSVSICIDVGSSKYVDKSLNKSEKYSNRSSNRAASKLNKSGQASDELDDEIGSDSDKLNRSLQARKNASFQKSTEKQVLNKSSKETLSRQNLQNAQNNSVNKSQADNSEEELDNIETYTEGNLKKKMRSLDKSEKCNENTDIDEVESESKKSEEGGKEDKDILINMEDSDENDDTQNKDLKYKSDLNYSTLALVGSLSNNSSKSSNDTTEDPFKHCEYISSLFELDSNTNNDDDDDISSINSDIKREYNLNASEQEYSDNNVPYDECRTSESESSDPDDTGSDLADFIVADDAIEGEKSEEERKEEQNNEDESVRAKTNISKDNIFNESRKIGKNKRKISTEHTMSCQLKMKEDITVKKSHTKKTEEINIMDTSGSTLSIKKKRKSHDRTEHNLIKQLNESEINRKKLSKMTRTSVECSTPKINSSKEEFANDVETAATSQVLTVEDTCQLIEKKKKKKIRVAKMDENVKDDVQQEDICRKKKETSQNEVTTVQDEAQHSKKKKKKKEKIVANVECNDIMVTKKKTKQQENNTEYSLPKESKKKKKKEKEQEKMKEEKIPLSLTGTVKSKSKSAKKTESEKSQLQNVFLSKTVESKNAAFIKARSEALEAIKSATERIKLHKKLKKKQQRDNENTIQEQATLVPIKRKKTKIHLEEQKQVLPSSTVGLKRLSDDIIDKLSDVPARVKKQKLSQNIEQIMPSLSMKNPKFLETKVKNRTYIPLSNSGGTTQFAIVNMSKAKKQPSKAINSVMSYRQRMLNKNNRESVSAYLMYLQKQHVVKKSAKDGFSDNAF